MASSDGRCPISAEDRSIDDDRSSELEERPSIAASAPADSESKRISQDHDDGNDVKASEAGRPRPPSAKHKSEYDVSKDFNDAGGAVSKSARPQESVEHQHLDEEGRPLSAYEIQRLERIKRNRQKLAQLGLAKAKEELLLEPEDSGAKKSKPPRPRKSEPVLPRRPRSSRAKNKSLNYAEPSASVRAILKEGEGSSKPEDDNSGANEQANAEHPERKRKWNRETERLPQDIYREFKRIKSHKREILKEAQRAARNAAKEIKFWTKRVEKYEKTFLRKKDETDEKLALGGKTSRELIQIVDERTPDIHTAVQEYEEYLFADQREHQRAINRQEAEEKMKMLDALVRFPKALKSSTALLNTALLEVAPKDPPPPRRSSRGAVPNTEENRKPSTNKRGEARIIPSEESKCIDDQDDYSASLSGVDQQDAMQDETDGKHRKRVARNVGGWVSPEFSRLVDRRWLDNDVPGSSFDMRAYVPQVGELVLYYITGHKQYLEVCPDEIGKKTRSKMRVPLWERARKLRDEADDKQVSPWWTNQWLDGIEADRYGDYPIVCCVERTHAEFPPDPWNKVVKPGDATNSCGQQIYFKKPRNGGKQARKQKLRLAIDLRPLTKVVVDGENVSLPPMFCVATSPSKSTEPFILPFCWTYFRGISLRVNQIVIATNDGEDKQLRLNAIDHPPLLGVLDEKDSKQLFASSRTWLESISSNDNILRGKVGQNFPLSIAKFLIHLWCENAIGDGEAAGDATDISFLSILQQTLPLWNSVSVLQCFNNRKLIKMSPWNLVVPEKRTDAENPWRIGQFKFRMDDSLRSKLLCFMDGILADESTSVGVFRDPVTEEVAPSYFCAVPIGFSLSRIAKRLMEESSIEGCYYRTSRQFIADVTAILDCALLYNNPESDVVSLAGVLTTKIKEAATVLIREHFRDVKEAEMLDLERRRMIQQRFSSQIGSAQATIKPFLLKPFRGNIQLWWTESSSRRSLSFQAGDSIQYCATKHEQFIRGHGTSLETRQAFTPFKSGDVPEWLDAEVVWTKADFPKALPKQTDKQCGTFDTVSTLQCLGLRFDGDTRVVVVYWRPCLLGEVQACKSCQLSRGESFLRLKSNDQSTTSFEAISRCIDFVKRRCANGLRPYEEDQLLTKASIKLGYRPKRLHMGRKLAPTFSQLFDEKTAIESSSEKKQTKMASKKQTTKTQLEVSRLLEIGFVPPWIMVTSKTDEEMFSRYKLHFPSPSMSLELVCLRLRLGFYRQREAIENDIVEAYCGTIFMLLFDSWNQRKGSLRMKRIARCLSTNKNWDYLNATLEDQLNHDEQVWVKRLLIVRELFSLSLAVVSDFPHAIRMFGLADTPKVDETVVNEVADPDEHRAEAYEKLKRLLAAVGRDECSNHFSLPSIDGEPTLTRLKITIGGEEVECDDSSCFSPISAIVGKRKHSVCLTLEKRPVCFPEFLGSPSEVAEGSKWTLAKAQGIYFHADDYENNDYLARLVFKRPGRSGACARCRAYRRSMMVCRVMRRHANFDYDWASELLGGEDYLNKLILSLKDDSSIVVDNVSGSTASRVEDISAVKEEGDPVNPRKMLEKANEMSKATENLVREAETYYQTPDRLSADFVKEAFPIDDVDGHYLYCVICGLTGDLLCCDGCSTVVHMRCIDLSEPPPGDWFCERCMIARTAVQEVGGSVTPRSSLTFGPFKRASFDETALATVTKELGELRAKRPTQKLRDTQLESKSHPQESDDESVLAFETDEISKINEIQGDDAGATVVAPKTDKAASSEAVESESQNAPAKRSRRSQILVELDTKESEVVKTERQSKPTRRSRRHRAQNPPNTSRSSRRNQDRNELDSKPGRRNKTSVSLRPKRKQDNNAPDETGGKVVESRRSKRQKSHI